MPLIWLVLRWKPSELPADAGMGDSGAEAARCAFEMCRGVPGGQVKRRERSCLPFSAGGGRVQPWQSLAAAEQGVGCCVPFGELPAVLGFSEWGEQEQPCPGTPSAVAMLLASKQQEPLSPQKKIPMQLCGGEGDDVVGRTLGSTKVSEQPVGHGLSLCC